MAGAPSISYEYITTAKQLSPAARLMGRSPAVALDLECDNNLHHYGTRVCLIQLSIPDGNFVVDAQAGLDLAPLGEIMEERRIEKVMHDTDFDLRCLDYEYGWHPKNLFDTQLAARLCGHKEIGLAALIGRYFGVALSKHFQRADWSVRPLSDRMLAYAAADSHYLLELRDKLAAELEAASRMEWAREEFLLRERTRFEPDERPAFARVKGAGTIKGRALAILSALADLREEIARELDLPVYQVISNEALIRFALHAPRSEGDLVRAKGLHPYCRQKGRGRILETIAHGMKAQPPKWPRGSRVQRRQESPELLDALKSWRKGVAAEEGVDPDLVIPVHALKRLSAGEPLDKVLSEDPVRQWQRDRFGTAIAGELEKFTGRGSRSG
ncbi:MAG: HRDC domain-containing protein [bacterium]